eukprot:gnl/TRDRNA2_/TRDRNA2_90122_c1_seq1.p1 gnl/TRDRNA2_/TRDRNA2_90122_c1~~gnl/TRDRNA2_/TRDRNA2_90122_c1_seq1.p1  ORF type:complete len:102 (-),score=6.50 gnl/TRDRNA2_/TRDRNA2_90122_c1_seq1:7-312(-)
MSEIPPSSAIFSPSLFKMFGSSAPHPVHFSQYSNFRRLMFLSSASGSAPSASGLRPASVSSSTFNLEYDFSSGLTAIVARDGDAEWFHTANSNLKSGRTSL